MTDLLRRSQIIIRNESGGGKTKIFDKINMTYIYMTYIYMTYIYMTYINMTSINMTNILYVESTVAPR